jgi:hypothetical protein
VARRAIPSAVAPAMASNAALLMAIRTMSGIWGRAALAASHRKSSDFVCGHEALIRDAVAPPKASLARTTALLFARRDLQFPKFYSIWAVYRCRRSARTRRSKDFVQILRLSAGLAALILTASTTCAAVIDLSTALGPSGHYTTQAYYRGMLGGQPMTAAQQAYADQEDQLRQLGFLSELGGDFALGQIFYRMAYGITPPPPLSALDLASAGVTPPSITPSGLVTGASDGADTGAGSMLASGNTGSGLTLTGAGPVIAVPEASTWAMTLIGFMGLGLTVYRQTRRRAALVTAQIFAGQSF